MGTPVIGADGTKYQTVVRYDTDAGIYRTTVIAYNGNLFIYHFTFDGPPPASTSPRRHRHADRRDRRHHSRGRLQRRPAVTSPSFVRARRGPYLAR